MIDYQHLITNIGVSTFEQQVTILSIVFCRISDLKLGGGCSGQLLVGLGGGCSGQLLAEFGGVRLEIVN